MIFNSLEYILFLPLVFVLFYLFRHKFRVFILLAASYYFYISWNPVFIILILLSTLIDYGAGLSLERTSSKSTRRLILGISICANLGFLFFFKYFNFALENVNEILLAVKGSYQPIEAWDIILPVGISFYTFQTMSYTIDVYNGKIKAEKNLSYFALYVCFFPQLVAGPIERYNNLMPQLKEKTQLVIQNISHGGRLILYGLFMKMVIADNLGVFVDSVYGDVAGTSSLSLLIGAVFYSFQIYCDFHGYTTIAIGSAKLFNVNLSENFRTPYLSTSVTEFWRNWHITLTTWFRDYIYYPLGGNRGTILKWALAILTVFIVSGVWHGAKWTFIFWGLFHALFVLFEKVVKWDKQSTNVFLKGIKWGVTFTLVTALWIFFRSPDMAAAILYFKSIGSNWAIEGIDLRIEPFILLGLFVVSDILTRKKNFALSLNKIPSLARGVIYFVLIFLLLSRSGTDMNPFIYFQF